MKYVLLISSILLLFSCKKFLDERPDKKMNVPSTVEDLQYLLDNYTAMNGRFSTYTEIMSDNYYLTSSDWGSLTDATVRNLYLWQADDNTNPVYAGLYQGVYQANVVIDHLDKITHAPNEQAALDNVKGSALFFRSAFFFEIASLFAKPFDKNTALNDLGIPLRLSSDFSEPSVRSSVQETYHRIIEDYKEAALLLPLNPLIKTRPSKPAAFAALARTFLAMRQYDSAGFYADQCLHLYDSLLDYNTLNAAAAAPVAQFNKEVIFHSTSLSTSALSQSRCKIDSVLYLAYNANDLRKTVFFKSNGNGSYAFKGNYDGSTGSVFNGLTVAEIYLIRAECYARSGFTALAMQDLNTVLQKRWKNGTFIPLTATSGDDALSKILPERRKELVMRGLRWNDLRRLSQEQQWTVIPKRIINNQLYDLQPGSPRYVVKFPKLAIDRSLIEQNP